MCLKLFAVRASTTDFQHDRYSTYRKFMDSFTWANCICSRRLVGLLWVECCFSNRKYEVHLLYQYVSEQSLNVIHFTLFLYVDITIPLEWTFQSFKEVFFLHIILLFLTHPVIWGVKAMKYTSRRIVLIVSKPITNHTFTKFIVNKKVWKSSAKQIIRQIRPSSL